ERAPREVQRVEVERDREAVLRAAQLRVEEADVPPRAVRHEDGAVEQGRDALGQLGERGRPGDRGAIDPVYMDVAYLPAVRADERVETIGELAAADALDAHLDDAVALRVEAGHLEIVECERRLRD